MIYYINFGARKGESRVLWICSFRRECHNFSTELNNNTRSFQNVPVRSMFFKPATIRASIVFWFSYNSIRLNLFSNFFKKQCICVVAVISHIHIRSRYQGSIANNSTLENWSPQRPLITLFHACWCSPHFI